MTGGRAWAVDLSDVAAVGREARDLSRPLSRPRPLLRIETTTGSTELFVVNRLDEVIRRLSIAVDDAIHPRGGRQRSDR
jgi:hypothetical protein